MKGTLTIVKPIEKQLRCVQNILVMQKMGLAGKSVIRPVHGNETRNPH